MIAARVGRGDSSAMLTRRCLRLRPRVGLSGPAEAPDTPVLRASQAGRFTDRDLRHSSAHLLAAAVPSCSRRAVRDRSAHRRWVLHDFWSRAFTPEDLRPSRRRWPTRQAEPPIEKKRSPSPSPRPVHPEGPDPQGGADPREVGRPRAVLPRGSSSTSASAPPRVTGRSRPSSSSQSRRPPTGRDARQPSMQRIYGYAFFTREAGAAPDRLEEASGATTASSAASSTSFSRRDRRRPDPCIPGAASSAAIEDYCRDEHLRAVRPGLQPPHREAGPVEDERAHRVLPGQHVLPDQIED